MALSSTGRAEQQQIGAFLEPAIACGQCHDLCLADHRHGFEVEADERFADGQSCFGKMTLDAATTTISDLVFGKRGQEASGRPAFLVRLLCELGPHQFDGGQTQVGEQQLDARGVDRIGRLHATPPSSTSSVVGTRTAASSS